MRLSNQSLTSEIKLNKAYEFMRKFPTLPNVLIQDPARMTAYYLTAAQLEKYEANIKDLLSQPPTTTTFVIPDGEIIEEVPPFVSSPESRPSVLIQYYREKKSYFLDFEDLQKYSIKQPEDSFDEYCVSFIIPRGTELIEEIPALRRGLLQSNTG